MPTAVTGPLSHPLSGHSSDTTSHTAAKQHLRVICQVGGWWRQPLPATRTLEENQRLLPRWGKAGSGLGPTIKSPPCSNHSSLQVKQVEGARHPSWGPQPSLKIYTCAHTPHKDHGSARKKNCWARTPALFQPQGPKVSRDSDVTDRLCVLS